MKPTETAVAWALRRLLGDVATEQAAYFHGLHAEEQRRLCRLSQTTELTPMQLAWTSAKPGE
jgi:hypothetical protein